jgi:LPS sulfotransferase NodH
MPIPEHVGRDSQDRHYDHPVLQLLSSCGVLSAGIEHKATRKETYMDTFTRKLAVVAGTLFMNALVMGTVVFCFALRPNTYMTAVALAQAVATQQGVG